MDEFDIIRRYFPAEDGPGWLHLGIADDAALLGSDLLQPDQELVAATDTLVAGRHFREDAEPEAIGWKALAVNLSDLAAMGAQPRAYLLALTLPEADEEWLAAFSEGLHAIAREHAAVLIGGDTTRGPLSVTITVLGVCAAGAALRRDVARPGQRIWVTGTLGDAALALKMAESAPADLRQRLDRPEPRVAAGLALARQANNAAAIDISDGLAADLGRILEASGVGAEVDVDALPASETFLAHCPSRERHDLQLCGGDDYELCVILPPDMRPAGGECDWTCIGNIVAQPGLRLQSGGNLLDLDQHGYRHFS